MNDSTLRVEGPTRLFSQSLMIPDRVTVAAGRTPFFPGSSGLSDLAADPVRRGIGTDLAGIHPVSSLGEPTLVIAISDGRNNLDGLYEGASNASVLNHRVVVVILADSARDALTERLRDSDPIGRQTVVCSPGQLWNAVNTDKHLQTRRQFIVVILGMA